SSSESVRPSRSNRRSSRCRRVGSASALKTPSSSMGRVYLNFRSYVKQRFSPDYGRVMTTDKSGRISAGLLLWRRNRGELEVLLAHMGGPFWVKKDHGHWTIPKGEIEPGEEAHAVALREFAEETGHAPPVGP